MLLIYFSGKNISVRKKQVPARRGRPPTKAAESHSVIMDAVYRLLLKKSVRDLTMEEIAKEAKVGKPTLYKWWPTKAALVLALYHERIKVAPEDIPGGTAEQALRGRVQRLIVVLNGLFGKVLAQLIGEAQSEPEVLRELYERSISLRRKATIADLERGKESGELAPDTDTELVVEAIFGAIYYRLLLRSGPLTQQYGEALVEQVIRGHRSGTR